MPYDSQHHHRRSIRLQGYDYTQPGAYFVTLCTQARVHLFGEVVAGQMQLSPYGRVVKTYWSRIPRQRPHVALGPWVVMPNHVHGIVVITEAPVVDEADAILFPEDVREMDSIFPFASKDGPRFTSPQDNDKQPHGAPPGSVGAIVGNFKSITTRRINRMRHTPGEKVWLRNYWERIVRDPRAYRQISVYIQNNPARWTEDQLHPGAPPNSYNRG
jgi:REP element-mobilizing transposase RayT